MSAFPQACNSKRASVRSDWFVYARLQGERVLITAAAGGAGHLATQLAARAGCDVVAVAGGVQKAALAERLAAAAAAAGTASGNCAASMAGRVVIDHTAESDLAATLAREGPYDLVLEHVGGPVLDAALGSLAPAGRLLIVGYISEYPHNSEPLPHAHGDLAERLFWSGEEELRGEQRIRGNVWPKDRQLVRWVLWGHGPLPLARTLALHARVRRQHKCRG